MIGSQKDRVVAVTGGAGLIGSFLVDELVAAGARVVVIDDFSKGLRRNIAHHGARIELREGDLETPDFARAALSGCDVVFHLASRAYGVGYSKGRHTEILQHNERITDNLLAAVAVHRPSHLLVTSSSCVYDDDGPDTIPELPLFDGEPERANRGYGWAKRFLEQKALIYAEETGVPVTIVRPFNIYGERYNWVGEFSQAIPMLVKKILDGDDPVTVWGSGRQRRNYIHATDCARIMLHLVEAGHTDGPVNIGAEDTVSLSQLVQMICDAAGKSPRLEFDTTKPEGRFVKSADATKLRSLLPGLRFSIDLAEGLKRMVGWYHETFPAGER
jgi:nucleoside-diphosphate-sugar epimerase